MKETENLKLKLPERDDFFNIEDLNGNFEILDEAATGAVGNLEDLKTEDKTSIVGSINELFTSASDGREEMATAITGKGIQTEATDALTTMARNVDSIITDPTGDADATAEDIVAPATAYSKGEKITGTLEKNNSHGFEDAIAVRNSPDYTTYIDIPKKAYVHKTSEYGYPEIKVPIDQLRNVGYALQSEVDNWYAIANSRMKFAIGTGEIPTGYLSSVRTINVTVPYNDIGFIPGYLFIVIPPGLGNESRAFTVSNACVYANGSTGSSCSITNITQNSFYLSYSTGGSYTTQYANLAFTYYAFGQ